MTSLSRRMRRKLGCSSQPSEPTYDEILALCAQLTDKLEESHEELIDLREVHDAAVEMMNLLLIQDPIRNESAVEIDTGKDADLAHCLSNSLFRLRASLSLAPIDFGTTIERTVH